MISSFYKFLCLNIIVGIGLCLSIRAQESPSVATPDSKIPQQKQAFLRFWNMLPKDGGEFVLMKPDPKVETGEALVFATPGNFYASYIPVPIGRYAFTIVRREKPETVLQTFDLLLRGDVCVTFLVRMADGQVKTEVIDDTYDPSTALTGRLTVRHQFPGAQVVVTAGTGISSRELAHGQTEILEGLPLKSTQVKMRARLADGKVQTWSTEVNFATIRRASLLVIPDPYDRFRPRVAVDGKPPGVEASSP